MRYVAAVICFVPVAVCAEPAPPRPPAPSGCIDVRISPDYVPGVDVQGRAVPPADVPSDSNISVSTDVFAEVRTHNPQAPSVGVEMDLSGLNPKPPCPAASQEPPSPEPAH